MSGAELNEVPVAGCAPEASGNQVTRLQLLYNNNKARGFAWLEGSVHLRRLNPQLQYKTKF